MSKKTTRPQLVARPTAAPKHTVEVAAPIEGYEQLDGYGNGKPHIVRETEKALLIEIFFGDEASKEVFFPKTQIQVVGEAIFASSWILDAKERDYPFGKINTI